MERGHRSFGSGDVHRSGVYGDRRCALYLVLGRKLGFGQGGIAAHGWWRVVYILRFTVGIKSIRCLVVVSFVLFGVSYVHVRKERLVPNVLPMSLLIG